VSDGGMRRLNVAVTIDVPEFYTEPVTLELQYTELQEGGMLDYSCTEPNWEDHLDKLRNAQQKE
jgi:hypothetical protein